jgi:hypothetical protein
MTGNAHTVILFRSYCIIELCTYYNAVLYMYANIAAVLCGPSLLQYIHLPKDTIIIVIIMAFRHGGMGVAQKPSS